MCRGGGGGFEEGEGRNLVVGGELRNKAKDIRDQVTLAVKATVILNFTLDSDGSL